MFAAFEPALKNFYWITTSNVNQEALLSDRFEFVLEFLILYITGREE